MARILSRTWFTACLLSSAFFCETATAQSIAVSQPAENDTLIVGSLARVVFESNGDVTATRSLQYSTNDGLSWNVFGSVNGGSSYTWEVPNTPTNQGRVKIVDQHGVSGISSLFHIVATGTVDTVLLSSGPDYKPKQVVTINWIQHGSIGNRVNIDISYDGGHEWSPLVSDLELGDGSSSPVRMPDTSVVSAVLRLTFSGGVVKQTAPFHIGSLSVWDEAYARPSTFLIGRKLGMYFPATALLTVFDEAGREVLTKTVAAGEFEVYLPILPQGAYYYTVTSTQPTATGRFIICR